MKHESIESSYYCMYDSNVHHGTPSSSTVTNSNGILVRTNIYSTIPLFKIILLFYFCISPLMHLLRIDSFIPNFGYAPPQKLKINHIFRKMMYCSCLVFVVLLRHHSLVLLDISSSSSSSSSLFWTLSLFGRFGWRIYFCLLPIKILSWTVINVIFIHT